MDIDARIGDVKYGNDGYAVLTLVARPGQKIPKGPLQMTVLNPPPDLLLEAAEGCDITGDSRLILMGQTVWADRKGGRRIMLRRRACAVAQ